MSTHALILIAEPIVGFRGIYVHADGYPSYVGMNLIEHYNTRRRSSKNSSNSAT